RKGVAERDRQLVASGHDGRRESTLRWDQSLLRDGLHRRSEKDRRADPRHAWRRRPDRPDRRLRAALRETAEEGDSEGPPGIPARPVYDTRRRGQSRASRFHQELT